MDKFVEKWRVMPARTTNLSTVETDKLAVSKNLPVHEGNGVVELQCITQSNDVSTSDQDVSKKASTYKRKFLPIWGNSFPWVHYDEQSDKVFCIQCKECYFELKIKLPSEGVNNERIYISFVRDGFSSWTKAIERFRSHEASSVHRTAVTSILFRKSKSVSNMVSDQSTQARIDARFCLLKIFETIKFLATQGLPLRGHTDDKSNFIRLLHLRAIDIPLLKTWMDRSNYKWTSHDIIDEILSLLSLDVQRKLIAEICKKPFDFYAVMADETTDISRKEQMSINFRNVDEKLVIHESFLGFYDIPRTDAETLFCVLKDSLLRFNFPFNKCRGQCYDGAYSVSGAITGLQTRFRDIEPRALYTHCAGHNLNLVSQDAMSEIPEIADFLSNLRELITFIRASAKRMNIFKNIQSQMNHDDDDDEEECEAVAVNKSYALKAFSCTRWCVRVKAAKSVDKNYKEILDFCENYKSETGDVGIKARGFSVYFSRFESLILLKITIVTLEPVEALNETLQATSINFKSVIRRVDILRSTLNSLRTNEKFNEIWSQCNIEAKTYNLEEPVLPRRRKPPKRLDSNRKTAYFPDTPLDMYRQIYFRVIDQIFMSLSTRFDSETYKKLSKMEDFATNKCSIDEIKPYLFGKNGECDFDIERLILHRQMFYDLDEVKQQNFKDLTQIQIFLQKEDDIREFCSEYTKFIRLLLTYPQTVCVAERSFSSLKRLKNYLRATLGQRKINDLAILHIHRDIADTVDMNSIMDEFICRSGVRKGVFALKSEMKT